MGRKRKAEDVLEVVLPITPMLDMAFQIMVFFIVTYHPSALEVHIDGNLLPPQAARAPKPKDGPPEKKDPTTPTKEKPPDTRETVVVIVEAWSPEDVRKQKVQAGDEGSIKRILVQKPENLDRAEVVADADDGRDERPKKLEAELRRILANNPNASSTDIDIKADGDLRHEFFINVYDVCKTRYGVETRDGKEVLVKIDSNHREASFSRVVGFQSVGFVPPPEAPEEAKKGGD